MEREPLSADRTPAQTGSRPAAPAPEPGTAPPPATTAGGSDSGDAPDQAAPETSSRGSATPAPPAQEPAASSPKPGPVPRPPGSAPAAPAAPVETATPAQPATPAGEPTPSVAAAQRPQRPQPPQPPVATKPPVAAERAAASEPPVADHGGLDALVRGEAHDPHGILGAHPENGHTVVRTLRPGATSVTLLAGDARHDMAQLHPGGVHGVTVPGEVGDYRLEVAYPSGDTFTVDDPYRWLPTLGELDLHLIREGRHEQLWTVLGAHPRMYGENVRHLVRRLGAERAWRAGERRLQLVGRPFAADAVARIERRLGAVRAGDRSGREVQVPDPRPGRVTGARRPTRWPSPPRRRRRRLRSSTTSDYAWDDAEWLQRREATAWHAAPMSVYEVHLGSWRAGLSYLQLADELVSYLVENGFTHVELLPVAEHPFGGSWGYQVTSYYAPTARFGSPDEFRHLVDRLHAAGIGVLVDWVPAHFPKDEWALARFDGTPLYEHADPRRGEQPDWGTLVFDFGRQRGPQLPRRQRAVLAGGVPHRRPPRGRRRLDALPRLLARRGRVAAEHPRRPREPGRRRVPPGTQRHRLQAAPRRR